MSYVIHRLLSVETTYKPVVVLFDFAIGDANRCRIWIEQYTRIVLMWVVVVMYFASCFADNYIVITLE
jgi:hypothetical protein